jgi:uncharacterized membrane protein YfcA
LELPYPAAAALLICVGMVAGTLNVLAGGGSLLSLPVLIFLGLSPVVANGTNRVAILIQTMGATWSFRRRGYLDGAWIRLAAPTALLGALVGIWAAIQVDEGVFQRVLAGIMVAVALWTLWNPLTPSTETGAPPPTRPLHRGLLMVGFFGVGFYGGFIQAGVGFVILALVTMAGLDLVRGNAMKVALVMTFTPLALAGFAWNGMVEWGLGFALATGGFLGAQLGVRLNISKGQEWVRRVVTVTVIVFAIRLWFSA